MDFLNFRGVMCAAAALVWCIPATAHMHETLDVQGASYDMRRLMRPTPAELTSEEKGHIHIYDSLEINEVNRALDQNFDRIQNMMFTRIRHLPPTGSGPAAVEDDGCD
jgi:hypothetical protein